MILIARALLWFFSLPAGVDKVFHPYHAIRHNNTTQQNTKRAKARPPKILTSFSFSHYQPVCAVFDGHSLCNGKVLHSGDSLFLRLLLLGTVSLYVVTVKPR